jgi:hypothetical protein
VNVEPTSPPQESKDWWAVTSTAIAIVALAIVVVGVLVNADFRASIFTDLLGMALSIFAIDRLIAHRADVERRRRHRAVHEVTVASMRASLTDLVVQVEYFVFGSLGDESAPTPSEARARLEADQSPATRAAAAHVYPILEWHLRQLTTVLGPRLAELDGSPALLEQIASLEIAERRLRNAHTWSASERDRPLLSAAHPSRPSFGAAAAKERLVDLLGVAATLTARLDGTWA